MVAVTRGACVPVPQCAGHCRLWQGAEIARKEMAADAEGLSALRDKLEKGLCQLEEMYVNGNKGHRMPHVFNISFKHVERGLMMTFNQKHSGFIRFCLYFGIIGAIFMSYMVGYGLRWWPCTFSIRFHWGRFITEEDVDFAIRSGYQRCQPHERPESPIWEMYKEGIDLNSVVWSAHWYHHLTKIVNKTNKRKWLIQKKSSIISSTQKTWVHRIRVKKM